MYMVPERTLLLIYGIHAFCQSDPLPAIIADEDILLENGADGGNALLVIEPAVGFISGNEHLALRRCDKQVRLHIAEHRPDQRIEAVVHGQDYDQGCRTYGHPRRAYRRDYVDHIV